MTNDRFFEAIDTAQTGHITPDQWLESLRNMHKAKGAVKIGKADRWLHSLLFTLERGCGARHFTAQQLAEAKTVFDLLASVETEAPYAHEDAHTPHASCSHLACHGP